MGSATLTSDEFDPRNQGALAPRFLLINAEAKFDSNKRHLSRVLLMFLMWLDPYDLLSHNLLIDMVGQIRSANRLGTPQSVK